MTSFLINFGWERITCTRRVFLKKSVFHLCSSVAQKNFAHLASGAATVSPPVPRNTHRDGAGTRSRDGRATLAGGIPHCGTAQRQTTLVAPLHAARHGAARRAPPLPKPL